MPPSGEPGRPPGRYKLTLEGEGLFQQTGALALAFADAIREEMGDDALEQILARVTDARVLGLQSNHPELPLESKVASLRSIYGANDAFVEVEKVSDGYRLIERNCPFLDVAMARPLLCSSTVTTLKRLLGREVIREERFQDGHGCCAFRIYEESPSTSPAFASLASRSVKSTPT